MSSKLIPPNVGSSDCTICTNFSGSVSLISIFADIDVFDIEINETDPEKFVQIVQSLEPTFGGINLEDIKAPECFYIEQELKKRCKIPIMHDDQHGTAIISAAALLNALTIQKKKIDKVKFVVNGAGAAAMACMHLYESLGARHSNFMVFDRKGILYKGRPDVEEQKEKFCVDAKYKDYDLAKAFTAASFMASLMAVALTSNAPRKIYGKPSTLFTWLG